MSFSHPRRSRRGRLRRWLTLAGGAWLCYAGSYVAFSSWGQFVTPPGRPAAPPEWAPGEFYDFTAGRWKRSHTFVYAPLLWLDQRWWHRAPR